MVWEQSAPDVNVVYGNGKFWIPSPSLLETLYGGRGAVRVVPDGSLQSIPAGALFIN